MAHWICTPRLLSSRHDREYHQFDTYSQTSPKFTHCSRLPLPYPSNSRATPGRLFTQIVRLFAPGLPATKRSHRTTVSQDQDCFERFMTQNRAAARDKCGVKSRAEASDPGPDESRS